MSGGIFATSQLSKGYIAKTHVSLTCAKPVLSATSLVAPDKHVSALTKAFRSVVVIRVSHANTGYG